MTEQITDKELRPDVAKVVERQVMDSPGGKSIDAWRSYETAKDAISATCGWDAPDDAYDQDQYDMAIRRYLDCVGL